MLAQLNTPAIIAHRGASAHAPENTLSAFKLAIEKQADAIELDAKLCASGEVVVVHDATLDRTTNGTGKVNETSLSDLKVLDAGSWFDDKFASERIPTLDEVFGIIGDQIPINVELTNYTSAGDDLAVKVAALVKRHKLTGSVFFSSFHPLTLSRARRAIPEVPCAFLTLDGFGGWLARNIIALFLSHQVIQPPYMNVTKRLITRAHRRGKRVNSYTINDAEIMRRLFSWGIDGIFTDDVPLARQVRAEVSA
ncbi:MAG: glycerophosphodiester phosphodiesterase [Chloroflexi bacterium]|nr:MAG: glycerophosphodiester phosphodiesterase [Chloroflexota bacterium]MBL1196191.1 glycerophosphodiester phosphodiesterase [Chloroflexota bacterium]NOH13484.1 glycerophosphodiester phosphodiesterase [Chloroflexota bacterium]